MSLAPPQMGPSAKAQSTPAPPGARQPPQKAKKHPRATAKHTRKIPSSHT